MAETESTSVQTRSLLRRIRYTPLRDLLRARVTARLDPYQPVRESGLADSAQGLITEVVRRTRLHRREKVDVARELVAHFQDALETEDDPETVAGAFGDPIIAARLIRRAKKRARSPLWKATVWTGRAFGAVFLFTIVWYAWAAAHYFTAKPNVAIDYIARINAPILAIPESERAWPEYRAAYLAIPAEVFAEDTGNELTGAHPGDESWSRALAATHTIGGPLARVRAAARMSVLGVALDGMQDPLILEKGREVHALTTGVPVEDSRDAAWEAPDRTTAETPMIEVLLDHINALRGLANFLALDARVAAHDADAPRTLENLTALVGLAGHSDEDKSLISQLVANAIYVLALENTSHVIHAHPELLSDEQLAALAHTIAGYKNGRITIDYQMDRMMFLDTVQRLYTDDGSGDGRLCAAGLRDFGGGAFPDAMGVEEEIILGIGSGSSVGGPIFASISASRRELVDAYERLIATAERDAAQPLWERGTRAWRVFEDEFYATPFDEMRYWILGIMVPAFSRASSVIEFAVQRRDATLTAIALKLYRRKNGSYPDSLDLLVPTFLPAVPPDRFTGEPLAYRLDPENGRPILYARGVDRDDDDARPPVSPSGNRNDRGAMDWMPRDRLDTLDASERRRHDGDWILFPPPPPDSD